MKSWILWRQAGGTFHFSFSVSLSRALIPSAEQLIIVIFLTHGLCRRFNILSWEKSHQQGLTSANCVGHTETTRAKDAAVSGPSEVSVGVF